VRTLKAESFIANYGAEFKHCIDQLPFKQIAVVAEHLFQCYRQDKLVAIIGNGGSAATASHLACDLGKTILGVAPQAAGRRFKVMALTDNMPLVTAWANDVNYDTVFAEQLKAWLREDDVVIAISASGNSPNIVEGVRAARQMGACTIGFLGFDGGKVARMVDHPITVHSNNYGYIEDLHMMFGHMITAYIRRGLELENSADSAADREQKFFSTHPTSVSEEIGVAAD
jgi:D-sedoheptulose 7-phosphate isomerase